LPNGRWGEWKKTTKERQGLYSEKRALKEIIEKEK